MKQQVTEFDITYWYYTENIGHEVKGFVYGRYEYLVKYFSYKKSKNSLKDIFVTSIRIKSQTTFI